MAVQSKMSGSDRRSSLAGLAACGMGAAALNSFSNGQGRAFATANQQYHSSIPRSAGASSVQQAIQQPGNAATAATSSLPTSTALSGGAVALGLAAAASHKSRRVTRSSAKATRKAVKQDIREQAKATKSASTVMDLAIEVAESRDNIDDNLIARIEAFAEEQLRNGQNRHDAAVRLFVEVCQGAGAALQGTMAERTQWASTMTAAMLLSFTVNISPVNALDQVSYSDFIKQIEKGNVEMAFVQSDFSNASYTATDGSRHEVSLIPNKTVTEALFEKLEKNKVETRVTTPQQRGGFIDFLANIAGPIAWLVAFLVLLFGGSGPNPAGMGPGGNPFQMGKSTARVSKDGEMKTRFKDVAGCDGAKEELVEVVDFLKNKERYSSLGAKIPKGCLLVGPPGTGKTLLAKAVAGEAGVPFFSVSAAEFVEVFAGVGAARVRDLFAEAKKNAPCIIFMDEIDAVGRQRSAGFGQGNDEREQTVNQLLTEMDGFEQNSGVVVLAATNRADILDQALVRPGRFDRQVQVDPPDVEGRIAILKVHAKSKSLAPGVDLAAIARQTPGMSGADLANLLNEGAIVAARQNKAMVDQDDIANALERIMIGLERKDAVMTEAKKKLVAYHEAGHAILGALMNDYDVVTKISIVPRGPAGGVTIFMPSEDRLNSGLVSKEFLENRMCVALGGRIAEELINGIDNVTTGASNDFQQCTQVAQTMVTQLGMSDVVGQRAVGQPQGGGNPFMGRGDFNANNGPPLSQKIRLAIDAEVKRIVAEQYARGKRILESNRYLLDKVAETLMDQEKMGGEELMKLITQVTAEGKLVAAPLAAERLGDDSEIVAAGFAGERVTMEAKTRCLHPDKSGPFLCSDCPRRGKCMPSSNGQQDLSGVAASFAGERDMDDSAAVEGDEPEIVAAGFAGERVSMEAKTRCLHPDKSGPFLCADCPRRGKSMPPSNDELLVQQDTSGVAASFAGERQMAVADGIEEGEEVEVVAAGFAGERVCMGAKTRCLHPDKSGPFLCADCPRRGKCMPPSTNQLVAEKVREVASELKMPGLPDDMLRSITVQVITAMALSTAPLDASADDALPPAAPPQLQQPEIQQVQTQQPPQIQSVNQKPQLPQQQQQQQALGVGGRTTVSRVLDFLEEGNLKRIEFLEGGRAALVDVKFNDRQVRLLLELPRLTPGFVEKLEKGGVQIDVKQPEAPNQFAKILLDIAFPCLIIAGLLFFRRMGMGGMGGDMPGMQGKAKVTVQPETGVKFEDVAGIDEAKEELTEVVDFLKAPERFVKVGAKIPRGVLLTGPPGTGKTLMAKALAGESGVPFIQASASEFIELFVGVGASRVRNIFKQAKEKAPCIVFIDEIDAIGRQRGSGMGGGNDEREQTLNQILTEMDGFEGDSGVIVVAATNRADILDQALLRPGRFDRRVTVSLPDVKGREQILKVHIKDKTLEPGIELEDIAKRTSGFSGADLQNLMNESAILAARREKTAISMQEVDDATDRVIAGLAGRALTDNASKKLIAYHEAGHALIGTLLPHHDPVNKVTLIPRGQAKGLTWFTPGEDQSLISQNQLRARICGALAGRAAEQIVFGTEQVTSGAGGDLQQVERMARAMVTQFGMSSVGSIAIDDGGFMGPNYSQDLAKEIDEAIHDITEECYLKTLTMVMENRACLDKISDELVEIETMSGQRLREIVSEFTEVPKKVAVV